MLRLQEAPRGKSFSDLFEEEKAVISFSDLSEKQKEELEKNRHLFSSCNPLSS